MIFGQPKKIKIQKREIPFSDSDITAIKALMPIKKFIVFVSTMEYTLQSSLLDRAHYERSKSGSLDLIIQHIKSLEKKEKEFKNMYMILKKQSKQSVLITALDNLALQVRNEITLLETFIPRRG